MKKNLILSFLVIGGTLNLLAQEQFEGYLEYSYRNEYRSKKDSLKEEKKLKAFFDKTGFEIGKRKSGLNKCYVKNDTLMISIFNKQDSLPEKNYIQMGGYAYTHNLITSSVTEFSKPNLERILDENLKPNWRDTVKVNQIYSARDKKVISK